MRKFTKRSAALVTAGVVAVGAAGAAYAAWSLTGSGKATATAGTVVALEVSGASTTPLVPGSTADVTLTVVNKNTFPVIVKGIDFSGITSDKDGCGAKDLVYAKAPIPTSIVIAAAASESKPATKTFAYPASLKMSANPAEACKLAKFTFETDVSAESHVSTVTGTNPGTKADAPADSIE